MPKKIKALKPLPAPAKKNKPNRNKNSRREQRQPSPSAADYYQPRSRFSVLAKAAFIIFIIICLAAIAAAAYFFLIKPGWPKPAAPADSEEQLNYNSYEMPLGITVPSSDNSSDNQQQSSVPTYTFILGTSTKVIEASGTTASTTATTTVETTSAYQFQYPPAFVPVRTGNIVKLTSALATDTQILVEVNDSNRNLAAYLKNLDQTNATAYEGQPAVQVKSENKLTSNNKEVEAIQRLQLLVAPGLQEKVTYVSYQGKIISLAIIAPTLTAELNQLYDAILASFKLN